MDGVEEPDGLTGDILVIGFGRFGQIATQALLAKGHRISIIDNDTDMIRAAGQFGFKVYYGDGTRLDILRAAGIETVDVVLIAVDNKDEAVQIAELVQAEFPLVKVMARAFDRGHAIELIKAGRRLPDPRDVRIGAACSAAETLRVLGVDRRRGRRADRGRARARPPALRGADRGRHAGRPRPAALERRGTGARERRRRADRRSR